MEMERINDNLIKVLIDTDDLAERGVNFLDLIGDQISIEKFFYSILEEVDIDQHFQESEAVTFQVMPRKDGLELYISRNNFDEMEAIWEDEITKRLIEHKQEIIENQINDNSAEKSAERQETDAEDDEVLEVSTKEAKVIYKKDIQLNQVKFDNLDDFLECVQDIDGYSPSSSLYFYQDSYYLCFVDEINLSSLAPNNPAWTILDYGESSKITPEILAEHGQYIRLYDALEFFGKQGF